MAAQSIASRSRRPKQAEPDDAVLARALQISEWARKNIVLVTSVAAIVVVLVGGLLWYRADRERRLEDAAIAFLPVEQAVLSGEETIAARELQLFIQRHGDTPYGDEARVLLAQVHLRGGRPVDAIEAVRPVVARLQRSAVGPQAALLMAAAQEGAGQTEAAIQTYLQVAESAETPFRQEEGLVGAAILREQSGDFAGAAELYRRLAEMNEGTPDQAMYEMRVAEAEAQAAR